MLRIHSKPTKFTQDHRTEIDKNFECAVHAVPIVINCGSNVIYCIFGCRTLSLSTHIYTQRTLEIALLCHFYFNIAFSMILLQSLVQNRIAGYCFKCICNSCEGQLNSHSCTPLFVKSSFIGIINKMTRHNLIDAKYQQMAFQSVPTTLLF